MAESIYLLNVRRMCYRHQSDPGLSGQLLGHVHVTPLHKGPARPVLQLPGQLQQQVAAYEGLTPSTPALPPRAYALARMPLAPDGMTPSISSSHSEAEGEG